MLTNKCFKENFFRLAVNFGFSIDDSSGRIYLEMIFESLKDKINDEVMNMRTKEIIQTITGEEWSKNYKYQNGRPTTADWIKGLVPAPRKVSYYEKCPITGVNLLKFRYENFNPSEKSLENAKKEVTLYTKTKTQEKHVQSSNLPPKNRL
jgi:hypothetical protein